jgi:hypothetical protein
LHLTDVIIPACVLLGVLFALIVADRFIANHMRKKDP